MNDKLLTPKQAAKNIGVSTRTLRRWKSRGVINPVPTPSGKIAYNPNDLKSVKNQKFNPLPPNPKQTTINKDLPITNTPNQSPPKSINIPRPPLSSTQQTIVANNSSPTPIKAPPPTIAPPAPITPQPLPSSEEVQPSPIIAPELPKPDQKPPSPKQPDSPSKDKPATKESPDKKHPKRIKKPIINKTAWAYAGIIGILLFLIGGWIILSKVFQNPTSTNSKATYNSNDQQETNTQTAGTIGSTTQNQNTTNITQNPSAPNDIIIGNRLRLNPQTPPSFPKAGDQYFNTTTNSMQYFDGTTWVDLNNSVSSQTLQKAYEAGGIIETTKGDLSFIMAESTAGDGDFLIQLAGNNSELVVSGGSDQDLITINDDALYPIDISQSTRVTGSLFANKLTDTQSSSYYIDPASTTTAAALAGNISLAGGITLTQNNEILTNSTDGYLTSSAGFSVGGASTYYFDTDGDINANQITLSSTLDANGQVDLGDGGDSITLSGSSLSLSSTNAIDFKPSNDSDDYIYLTTSSSSPALSFRGISTTNDPGIRANSSSGEIEYRDEDSSTWVTFDSLGGSSSIFTDGSGITYLTDTAEDFAVGGTTSSAPFFVDAGTGNTSITGTTTLNTVAYTWPGTDGTGGYVLSTNGSGTLSWIANGSGSSYWTQASGVVHPTTTTDDLAIGGTDSSSPFFVDAGTGNTNIAGTIDLGTNTISDGSLTGNWGFGTGNLSGITNLTITGNLIVPGTTTLNTVAYTWPGSDAGVSGYVLSSNAAGTLSWIANGSGSSYWTQASGVVYPTTTTDDLAIGGTDSSSPFFVDAATGNTIITGTSDLRGDISNSTGNLVLADTLDLGSATTGINITTAGVISDSDGNISLNDSVDVTGNLTTTVDADFEGTLTSGTGNAFNVDASGNIDAGTWTSTAIGAGYGGTDQTSYAVGDLLYADGATSLAKLADVAVGSVLLSGGVGVAPAWGTVTLGTHTTGNYVSSITDTANQITASAATGDVTLSLPSDLRAPGTFNAVSGLYTGATAGTQRLDASGNLVNIGTTQLNTVTYTWPGADGTNGYVLSTNGGGTLSWVSVLSDSPSVGAWTHIDHALHPDEYWADDLIIGGNSTASATFQAFADTGNVVSDGNLDVEGTLTSGTGNAFNVDASGNIDAGTWTSTAIGAGYGGTDQTSYAVGDLLYADGATSLAKLADVAVGSVLLSGGVTTAPAWGTVTLGTHTTGNYVSSITGTANQITASAATGDVTLSLPSDLRAPGTFNAVSGLYTGATAGTQRIDASGNLVNIGTTQLNTVTYTWPGADGTNGYVLSTNAAGALSWIENGSTTYWSQALGAIYPTNTTTDILFGDTASTSAEFAFLNVDPSASGDPTFQIAYDGSNKASFSVDSAGLLGIVPTGGELNLTGSLDISTGSTYQINDVDVLSATTLGTSVITSSLTTVGILNSGSITSGFGNIDIGSSNLDADGTITFAGISDGLVLATSGALSAAVEGTDFQEAITFENGLTEATQVVKWGGALTGNTTITQDSAETISFANTGTGNITFNLSSTGDFDIQDNGTSSFFVRDDGNVGIGTNAPESLLEIQGIEATDAILTLDADDGDDVADTWYIESEAADNDLSFVQGVTEQFKIDSNGYITAQRFVDTANSAYYIDPAASGTSVNIDGDIISNGAFSITSNGTNGNITIDAGSGTVTIGSSGTGKLDSGTIDPPYMINGEKYATFLSSMIGVKEEHTNQVVTSEYVPGVGYRSTIDFTSQPIGSDLWLFGETSNLREHIDRLSVLLSPAGNTRAWYELDTRNYQLNIYTTTPTQVSYRLTAPRFDAETWTNTRDSASTGFILDNDGNWETNQDGTVIGSTSSLDNIAITLDNDSNFILTDLSGQIIESISTYSESVIANLRAGIINARRVVTEELVVDGQDIANLIVSTVQSAINSGDIISPLSAEFENIIEANSSTITHNSQAILNLTASNSFLETSVSSLNVQQSQLNSNDASQSSRIAYLESIQSDQQNQIDDLETTKYDIPTSTTNLGQLPSPTIEGEGSSLNQNKLILDDLVSNYASISALIANNQFSAITNIASASSDLIIDNLNIANLSVDMLSINQLAVVEDNLMLTNNSLQTISNDTIFIQPAGGNINLSAGLMTLSPDGNSVTIDGDLNINGKLVASDVDIENDLKVKGAITAGAIKSEFGELLDIRLATSSALAIYQDLDNNPSASIDASGSATFNRLALPHSTGTGTLYTGDQNLTTSVDDITLESQVFITFSGDYSPATKYWVTTDWRENTFTIHLNYPVASPVDINWMIIN